MRNGFFSSLIILVTSAGMVWSAEPMAGGTYPSVDAAPQGNLETPTSAEIGVAGLSQDGNSGYQSYSPFWVTAEYLQWWIKNGFTPPLVTTSTATSSGLIGSPGTTIINGGGPLDYGERQGGRFTMGTWVDCGDLRL